MILEEQNPNSSLDEQVQVLKALTHPARIEILRILEDGEHCVCHMEAYLGYRQAYISQQLSVLREAGLVEDRKDGWNVFYRATKPEVFAVLDLVGKISGTTPSFMNRHEVVCPCPHCVTKTNTEKVVDENRLSNA